MHIHMGSVGRTDPLETQEFLEEVLLHAGPRKDIW